jgi:hypothetical protein
MRKAQNSSSAPASEPQSKTKVWTDSLPSAQSFHEK